MNKTPEETEFVETQKKSEFQDLTEEDAKQVLNHPFNEFKKLFPFKDMTLNHAIQILLVVRQRLENEMSQRFMLIKDVHKKHSWLNQKISDALKMNTIAIIKHEQKLQIEKLTAEHEENKKNEQLNADEKAALNTFIDTLPKKTPMEEQGIVDNTNGERRFHVVPGTES